MSLNSFGHLFRVTTWGESHGPALGCVIDGCPPGVALDETMIQRWLDLRKPGTSKFVTQRREPDVVEILSGVFEGVTTGTPVSLMIRNADQRSKDYGDIKDKFRPGHADYTYFMKYGVRDYRGGGRSSARETAARVAAGGVARAVLADLLPGIAIQGAMVRMGDRDIASEYRTGAWDRDIIAGNPFWTPDPQAAEDWAAYLDGLRRSGDSVGAVIEVRATGVPPGLGAPIYGKIDTDLAAAMMSINAVKGVEIGDGFAAAALTGSANADEMRMRKEPLQDVVEWQTPWTDETEKGFYTAPIPRLGGEEKRCYLESHEVLSFTQNPDGSATFELKRERLVSRRIDNENLPVLRTGYGDTPVFSSNHAGGILGGITTGQDVTVRFAVKPTSSILTPRTTVDRFGNETEIVTKGRHDPCVGIRAVPVGEAMMACVLLDHVLLHRGQVGANRGRIG